MILWHAILFTFNAMLMDQAIRYFTVCKWKLQFENFWKKGIGYLFTVFQKKVDCFSSKNMFAVFHTT